MKDNFSASTSSNINYIGFSASDVVPRSWDYFDEQGYIKRGGLRTGNIDYLIQCWMLMLVYPTGEDPYIRNRFNQQASDSLSSNREIPDTRNPM